LQPAFALGPTSDEEMFLIEKRSKAVLDILAKLPKWVIWPVFRESFLLH
jgi:hypothetical protein